MQELIGQLLLPPRRPRRELCSDSSGRTAAPEVSAPFLHREGGTIMAVRGRPRIGAEPFDAATVARRLLELYRERGRDFLGLLRGPFAVAFVDDGRGEALLAIDRMGIGG